MTYTEVERAIVDLRSILNFVRVVLSQDERGFLYCAQTIAACPSMLDYAEEKIHRILNDHPLEPI